MARVITLRDLHPLDILILRDLVRFGVLADDQIQRRYGNAAVSSNRLALLESGGFINRPRADVIQSTVIYTATRYGTVITRCGLAWRTPREGHLAHDIAVVDQVALQRGPPGEAAAGDNGAVARGGVDDGALDDVRARPVDEAARLEQRQTVGADSSVAVAALDLIVSQDAEADEIAQDQDVERVQVSQRDD